LGDRPEGFATELTEPVILGPIDEVDREQAAGEAFGQPLERETTVPQRSDQADPSNIAGGELAVRVTQDLRAGSGRGRSHRRHGKAAT
jgi:hypothetical protein